MNPTVKELRTAAWVLRWFVREYEDCPASRHALDLADEFAREADRIEAETPQVTPQEKPA